MDVRVPTISNKQLQLDGHASGLELGGPLTVLACNGLREADCGSDALTTSGAAASPAPTSVSAACGRAACMQEQYLNGGSQQHQDWQDRQKQQYLRLGSVEQRLMAMCNHHAMFHFLFDREGNLLAANRRAMDNMKGKVVAERHGSGLSFCHSMGVP